MPELPTLPPPREVNGAVVPSSLDHLAISPSDAGAYQWWYFDGLSDDGRFGFVAIYFVGGVFSALYADRIAAGVPASPFDHPMVNLALYDRAKQVGWVFSEHPRDTLHIDDPELALRIGRSSLVRRDGAYDLRVIDRDFPRKRDLDAKIRLVPSSQGLVPPGARLSDRRPHFWGSPAPASRVSVDVPALGLKWEGHGYHDVNYGAEPLHHGFREWGWGRAQFEDETRIFYESTEIDGTEVRRVLSGAGGKLTNHDVPKSADQGRSTTPWLLSVPRTPSMGELGGVPVGLRRARWWESSPFYARYVGEFSAGARKSLGVCEHVDLARFASPFVRFMLRYRIYRLDNTGKPLPVQVRARDVFPSDPA